MVSISNNIRGRLRSVDWALLKGSALISSGMLVSRLLGFIFYLVLARNFTPGEYGHIQYAIVIGEIVAAGTQPFGQHVIARFIGKYKDCPQKLVEFSSNAWVAMALLFVVTMIIGVPWLILQSLNLGAILIVFVGITLFYGYWGVARGYMASGRLVIAYLGSNTLQLVLTLVLIQLFKFKSIFLALAIYGANYLVFLVILQIIVPLQFSFEKKQVSYKVLKDIFIFFLPIFISHITYLLSFSLDLLLLKLYMPIEVIGKYSLAKSLTAIFSFVPSGIATVLMPRIASQPASERMKLVIQSLALCMLLNVVFLSGYILVGEWTIENLFGSNYLASSNILITLSLGAMLLGFRSILSAFFIGIGKADWETLGWMVILLSSVISGWYLIPRHGALGAAWMIVIGSILGLLTYVFLIFLEKIKK